MGQLRTQTQAYESFSHLTSHLEHRFKDKIVKNFKIVTTDLKLFPPGIMYNSTGDIGLPWWLSGNESTCQGRRSLGCEEPLEKEMEICSSILVWKIPWTGAWWAIAHGVSKGS